VGAHNCIDRLVRHISRSLKRLIGDLIDEACLVGPLKLDGHVSHWGSSLIDQLTPGCTANAIRARGQQKTARPQKRNCLLAPQVAVAGAHLNHSGALPAAKRAAHGEIGERLLVRFARRNFCLSVV
jgi:hypothetical protein